MQFRDGEKNHLFHKIYLYSKEGLWGTSLGSKHKKIPGIREKTKYVLYKKSQFLKSVCTHLTFFLKKKISAVSAAVSAASAGKRPKKIKKRNKLIFILARRNKSGH